MINKINVLKSVMRMGSRSKKMMMNTGQKIDNVLQYTSSPVNRIASGISRKKGLKSTFLKEGAVLGTVIGANALTNYTIGNQNKKIPPNAQIYSGKRGIDANNLNASGVGLAMHKNRRSF